MSVESGNSAVRTTRQKTIFFAQNEPSLYRKIKKLLTEADFTTHCYKSPSTCLRQLDLQTCDLLITDYNMPEMSGIALMKKARRILPWLPVLIITGNGDIPLAVSAIQSGADDLLEKPLNAKSLLAKIEKILHENRNNSRSKIDSLTKMERRVFTLIMQGNNNKEIALVLNRSRRTVENHRARLMKKLGAHNVASLVKNASQAGIVDFTEEFE